MSRPIDEKIAKLTLDNSDLKSKAQESAEIFAVLSKDIANNADFGAMADNVEQIANKFSTTGLMFQEVVRNMTNSAINGLRGLIDGSLGVLMEKGSARALNIEQAKFQFEGLGMDIEKSMQSANDAVTGTAFGLDEAAVVAANFGATGMRAGDEMTNALRGIAGVAAMSGSSFSDVGNIFSKVAGQGRLMGSDLLRLSSRGINAAATLGNQLGLTEVQVREMVTKGEIDFQTFANAMNEAFGEHSTKANETYTGSLANMQSAIGRIGATLYTNKYENKKNLFNAIRPQIDAFHEAIKPALEAWNAFSTARNERMISKINSISFDGFIEGKGPERFAAGLRNIFNSILDFTGAIGKAWSNVFGGNQNGDFLVELTKKFHSFTNMLRFSDTGLQRLQNTFEIFFIALKWVTDGVGLLMRGFGLLIPSFDRTRDGAEGATGGVLSLVRGFDDWLRSSPKVQNTLKAIGDGLTQLSEWIVIGAGKAWEGLKVMGQAIADAYVIAEPYIVAFAKAVQEWIISKWIEWKPSLLEFAETIKYWAGLIWDAAKDLSGKVAPLLQEFWEKASGFFGELDWKKTLKIGAILAALYFVYETYWKIVVWKRKFTKGEEISFFAAFNRGVGAMINIAKAATITAIAVSLAALAGSVWLFGKMDTEQLVNGMVGVATGLFFLSSSFKIIAEASKSMKGFSALVTVGTIMTALTMMTGVILVLSRLDWDTLSKGLVGVGGSLLALSFSVKMMGSVNGKIMASAAQLLALSVSLTILTVPLQIMGSMDWSSLGKGLFGIASALGAIAMFNVASAGGWANLGTSIAVSALAASLIALTIPIKIFSMMDLGTLAKGLGAMAVALGIVAAALFAMPVYSTASAGAVMLMAASMMAMTVPLKIFGQMDLKNIGVGLLAIAGVLTVFVVAVYAIGMHGAAILTAVAAALTSIGIAALGTTLLVGALIVMFTKLADLTGPLFESVGGSVDTFLRVMNDTMPKIVGAVVNGVAAIADGLIDLAGVIGNAAVGLVIVIMETMLKHMPKFIDVAANMILTFIQGMAQYTPPLVSATVMMAITFINALATTIANNGGLFIEAVGKLIGAASILLAEGLGYMIETFFWFIPGAKKAGEALSGGVVDGLRDRFNLEAAEEAGGNYVDVFTGEVTSEEALGRGHGAGGNLSYATTEGLREGEEEFDLAGESGVMGYIQSLMDGEPDAEGAGQFVGGGAFEGIGDFDFEIPAMDQLGDYSEVFEEFDGTELGYGAGSTTHGGMNQFFNEYPLEGLADEELEAYLEQFKERNEEVRTEAEREARYSYTGMDDFFDEYPMEGIAEDEIDAYIQKFRDHNEKVRQQGEETAKGSEKGIDSVPLDPAGKRKVEEYNSGVTHQNPNTRRTGSNVSRKTEEGVDSVTLTPAGKRKAREYATGITHENTTTYNAGASSARSGRRGAGSVSYTSTGRQAAQGLANGMRWNSSIVTSAGNYVATVALNAMRGAFRTQSPSKETFEIGQYVGEGLANGIVDEERNVGKTSRHMALEAINAIENTAKDFNAKIFDRLNLQPTITPVLDLSNIDDQGLFGDMSTPAARRLANLFNPSDRNLERQGVTQAGDTITNEYHAHITAYGNMPDSMIRNMAGKLQGEFKRMSDRKEISRGGVIV